MKYILEDCNVEPPLQECENPETLQLSQLLGQVSWNWNIRQKHNVWSNISHILFFYDVFNSSCVTSVVGWLILFEKNMGRKQSIACCKLQSWHLFGNSKELVRLGTEPGPPEYKTQVIIQLWLFSNLEYKYNFWIGKSLI
jgi:hypothetical protein